MNNLKPRSTITWSCLGEAWKLFRVCDNECSDIIFCDCNETELTRECESLYKCLFAMKTQKTYCTYSEVTKNVFFFSLSDYSHIIPTPSAWCCPASALFCPVVLPHSYRFPQLCVSLQPGKVTTNNIIPPIHPHYTLIVTIKLCSPNSVPSFSLILIISPRHCVSLYSHTVPQHSHYIPATDS